MNEPSEDIIWGSGVFFHLQSRERKKVIYELKIDLKYHPGFLLLSIDRHHLSRFLPLAMRQRFQWLALAEIFNEYLIRYHISYLCYASGSQIYQLTLARIFNDLNIL